MRVDGLATLGQAILSSTVHLVMMEALATIALRITIWSITRCYYTGVSMYVTVPCVVKWAGATI